MAGTSEQSAADIQSVADGIAADVRTIASRIKTVAEKAAVDAQSGQTVVASLDKIRADISALSAGSQQIFSPLSSPKPLPGKRSAGPSRWPEPPRSNPPPRRRLSGQCNNRPNRSIKVSRRRKPWPRWPRTCRRMPPARPMRSRSGPPPRNCRPRSRNSPGLPAKS